MRDTKTMEVVDGSGDLMSNLLGSILWDLEVFSFKIGEEVSSLQVLHHNIDVV